MTNKTTIQISKALKEDLNKMRLTRRESFEEILRRKLEKKGLIDKKTTLGGGI